MKNFGMLLVLVVLSMSASLSFAIDKPVVQSYAAMTKAIGLPVPTKEQFQKMLQKFADELHGKGFKEFSEKDFSRGSLLYQGSKVEKSLIALLYHTQSREAFDIQMRSWWQRYDGDRIIGPTNAQGMMKYDSFLSSFDSDRLEKIRKNGIVLPVDLRREVAGAAHVEINFDVIDLVKLGIVPSPADNIIHVKLKNETVFLAVSYKK